MRARTNMQTSSGAVVDGIGSHSHRSGLPWAYGPGGGAGGRGGRGGGGLGLGLGAEFRIGTSGDRRRDGASLQGVTNRL
jgi:hypothetical protein